MKFNLVLLFSVISIFGFGQSVSKKDIRGVFEKSTGDPARTIQRGDSSFVSIPYLEYSREELKLKRFGRLVLHSHSIEELATKPTRGKWKFQEGIVILYINGEILKYKFRLPVYLESTEGKRGYQKKIG